MGYGPLWSLAVEEQFYLFWPVFVRRFSNRTIALISVGVFLNSAVWALSLHTNSPQASFPIWIAAHGLALGDLLALFLRSKYGTREHVGKLSAALTTAGFGSLWLAGFDWRRPQMHGVIEGAGYDFLFASLLLVALLVGTSRYAALCRPKVLQFFGDISYGLYLIHVLVFTTYRRIVHPSDDLDSILLQLGVCFLVAVALATVSRFTVEAWFLSLKDKPLKVWRKRISSEEFEELTPVCEVE